MTCPNCGCAPPTDAQVEAIAAVRKALDKTPLHQPIVLRRVDAQDLLDKDGTLL